MEFIPHNSSNKTIKRSQPHIAIAYFRSSPPNSSTLTEKLHKIIITLIQGNFERLKQPPKASFKPQCPEYSHRYVPAYLQHANTRRCHAVAMDIRQWLRGLCAMLVLWPAHKKSRSSQCLRDPRAVSLQLH